MPAMFPSNHFARFVRLASWILCIGLAVAPPATPAALVASRLTPRSTLVAPVIAPYRLPTRHLPRIDAPGPAPTPSPARTPAPGLFRQLADQVARALRQLGPWAPVALILLLVLTCLLCVPGAFLTLASGALFGVAAGLAYVWVGTSLGAAAAFLVGRYLAHDRAQRLLQRHPRLAALEEAVSTEGWKIVFLSRLAPGSPFFLLNYVSSLTRIRFLPYFLATIVSTIPGSLLLVYLGSLGQLALAEQRRTPWDWALRIVGLIALVLLVLLVTRRAKRALDDRLKRPAPDRQPPAA